jgi:hypothetical protein
MEQDSVNEHAPQRCRRFLGMVIAHSWDSEEYSSPASVLANAHAYGRPLAHPRIPADGSMPPSTYGHRMIT